MKPGDIISYLEMCAEEKVNLQRGMNYHLRPSLSVILMSLRPGAPYADRIEEDGIYMETNLSSNSIVTMCLNVIALFGYSAKDFSVDAY